MSLTFWTSLDGQNDSNHFPSTPNCCFASGMDSLPQNRLQEWLYNALCISTYRVGKGLHRTDLSSSDCGDFREYVEAIQTYSKTRQTWRKSRWLTTIDEKTLFWRKLGVECSCDGDKGFLLNLIRATTPKKHFIRQLHDVGPLTTKSEAKTLKKRRQIECLL